MYVAEMKTKGARLSHHILGKILLGSERKAIGENEASLSFYGMMEGVMRYSDIRPRLKEYFDKNIYIETENKFKEFFSAPIYNRLSETSREGLINAVAKLPIEKTTESFNNPNVTELRKTFPRSHEPWSEKEILYFRKAVEHTNDVEFLSKAFQRSVNSIEAAYKQTLKKSELIST
jgi:hypothetical protein